MILRKRTFIIDSRVWFRALIDELESRIVQSVNCHSREGKLKIILREFVGDN